LGTAFPEWFTILAVARTAQVLSVLSAAAMIIFFIVMYRESRASGKSRLATASMLGIIGSCAGLLVTLKGFVLVFPGWFSPYMVGGLIATHTIEVLLPWVSGVLFLYFILVFWEGTRSTGTVTLRNASLAAVVGSAFGVLVATAVLLNWLITRDAAFIGELAGQAAIIVLPLLMLSALAVLYFFLVFHREQMVAK
jgi:hypothetical protein